jgi:hypothetical protein
MVQKQLILSRKEKVHKNVQIKFEVITSRKSERDMIQ